MLRHENGETILEEDGKITKLGRQDSAWRNYYYGISFTARIVIGEEIWTVVWLPEPKVAMVSRNSKCIFAKIQEADTYEWPIRIHASRIEITELYHNMEPVQILPIVIRNGSYEMCSTKSICTIRCPYQNEALQIPRSIGEMCRDIFKKLDMKPYEYATGKETWRPNGKIGLETRTITMVWERNPQKKGKKPEKPEMPEVTKKQKVKRKKSEAVSEVEVEVESEPEAESTSNSESEVEKPTPTSRQRAKKASAKPKAKTRAKAKLPPPKDPHDYIYTTPTPTASEKPSPPSGPAKQVVHLAIKSGAMQVNNPRHSSPEKSDSDYVESETDVSR